MFKRSAGNQPTELVRLIVVWGTVKAAANPPGNDGCSFIL